MSRRASDLADCEDICLRETQFVCRTMAFTGGRGGDNCDLTDRDFRDLSYRDMEEDRDWDIIERTRCVKILTQLLYSDLFYDPGILASVGTAWALWTTTMT